MHELIILLIECTKEKILSDYACEVLNKLNIELVEVQGYYNKYILY